MLLQKIKVHQRRTKIPKTTRKKKILKLRKNDQDKNLRKKTTSNILNTNRIIYHHSKEDKQFIWSRLQKEEDIKS